MLDLHRLRLLRELHARGTIAAVADALRFTPSAVSQQLAVLEREAGVKLLERAGRGVRLTDAARVLVGHADALLERAEIAEAQLAAAAGHLGGRARIATFQSAARHLAIPAVRELAASAPDIRCEVVEAEPERALPALALGDYDLVLADEWQHLPRALPAGVARKDLLRDELRVCLAEDHPVARRHPGAIPLAELAGEPVTAAHVGGGWAAITVRTCRELGGFDPDIRHRGDDAALGLALAAEHQAVTFLPDLVRPGDFPGVTARPMKEGSVHRIVFAATRRADADRPSLRALLAAVATAAGYITAR